MKESEDNDFAMRLNSLQSLLSMLPPSHYFTLDLIISHFALVVKCASNEKIMRLATVWGNILHKPEVDNGITVFDKHAMRFFKVFKSYMT